MLVTYRVNVFRKRATHILNFEKELEYAQHYDLSTIAPFSKYPNKCIFQQSNFTDVLTGKHVLNHEEFSFTLHFDQGGLKLENIFKYDVFVRAGQLSSYVKSFIYDLDGTIHKKFTDSNTYSKTMKLGFRLEPLDVNNKQKRLVCYVKLFESLQNLRDALLGEIRKYSNPTSQIQNSINNDLYDRLQRMVKLLLKLLEMRTVLSKALKEIRHLKYKRGAVDLVDVEVKAEQVDMKIENLLVSLSHIV